MRYSKHMTILITEEVNCKDGKETKLLTFNPTPLHHSTLKVSREKSYFYQAKLTEA